MPNRVNSKVRVNAGIPVVPFGFADFTQNFVLEGLKFLYMGGGGKAPNRNGIE